MDNQKLDMKSAAFGLSAIITILLNTLLVWAKESYKPLEEAMTTLSGHHWITHSIFDIVLFIGLGYVFYYINVADKIRDARLVNILYLSVIVSTLGLASWFL